MTHVQLMLYVILPQALRNIMPQIGNAKPWQISGGQKQRVAITRALAMEPEEIFGSPKKAKTQEFLSRFIQG